VVNYYLYQNDAPKGPYTLGQLRSMWHAGTITSETPFCPVGGNDWLNLKVIAGQLENESQGSVKAAKKPAPLRMAVWALAVLVLATCAFVAYSQAHRSKPAADSPTPTPTPALLPKLPPNFEPRLSEFLRDATRLFALTRQGTTIAAYGEQLATVATTHEMLVATWPADYAPNAKEELRQALRGWRFVLQLWQESIKTARDATSGIYIEPDARMYFNGEAVRILDSYAPGRLIHGDLHGGSKEYIRFNANIGVLMTVAAEHFRLGKGLLEGDPLGR